MYEEGKAESSHNCSKYLLLQQFPQMIQMIIVAHGLLIYMSLNLAQNGSLWYMWA